jgi:perosamine synthetase
MRAPTKRPKPIPLSAPSLGPEERSLLEETLAAGWVSSAGPYVDRFEHSVARVLGSSGAVATASGTAALHVSLLLAGVQPDDEVPVSALSFIAPANAIRYTGAWPVFIDVDRATWQMDPAQLEQFLEFGCERDADGALRNRTTGRRVSALLPVHALGHPVDMDPIVALGERHGLPVVEDAAEAVGARYLCGRATAEPVWRPVGGLGDVAAVSFNGNKIVTCGGGGAVVTDSAEWEARARHLTTQAKADPVEYIHDQVGFNYRLTSLQAAVGSAQLEKLDGFVAAKRRIAERYADELGSVEGIEAMPEAPWARSSFWLYTILLDE